MRAPLTRELRALHLRGAETLAVYPLFPDGTTRLICWDFDRAQGPEALREPRVVELAHRVTMVSNPELDRWPVDVKPAIVEITLENGRRLIDRPEERLPFAMRSGRPPKFAVFEGSKPENEGVNH